MASNDTPMSSFSGVSDLNGSTSDFLEFESTLDSNHDFLGAYFQSRQSPALNGSMSKFDQPPLLASKASTSTMMQGMNGDHQQSERRLRSQYPADSAEKHVEYILVASFDIDRGSIMEFQYPTAISGDEQMLAELMLPDQAHNRSQDWTIFFLHKEDDTEGEDDEDAIAEMRKKRRSRQSQKNGATDNNGIGSNQMEEPEPSEDSDEEETEKLIEGPPLIYVLNLVNTKHDTSVRRSTKAKDTQPLLLLALDEYFKVPTMDTLATLFEAVNRMDLSLMPRLSLLERNILQSTTARDMFVEKFGQMIRQQQPYNEPNNLTSSHAAEIDETPNPNGLYALPRDTHNYETKVYYNSVAVPIKVPTARSPETVGDFSIIKLIQTFSTPHNQSPQPFPLHPHLTTGGAHTHPIIVLVNALLTQKRVIFIGHNMPSGEVADAVLAACALASGGTLRGFTRHAFPYTDLTKIDALLNVPGFVAGVTNPAFANKPEWWDLLCDLPTGRIKISGSIEQPPTTDGIQAFQQQNPTVLTPANIQSFQMQDVTGDTAFMESVLRNISNRLGEGVIRTMWRDWISKFVRIAAAFEESVYGESPLSMGLGQADEGSLGIKGHGYVWGDDNARVRELAANINRIEGWRPTRTYFSLKHDLALLQICRPITTIDLNYHHDRLRTQKLTKEESAAIYLAFERAIGTPSEVNQLLTVTPESHGGLFYISLGLLHPRRDVRVSTVRLLERVQTHEAGRHFWNGLSRFTKMAFLRTQREAEQADGGDEALFKTTTLLSQTSLASG